VRRFEENRRDFGRWGEIQRGWEMMKGWKWLGEMDEAGRGLVTLVRMGEVG
jgi:hypothetical protein